MPTSECCVCVCGVLIQKSRFDYRCQKHEFLKKKKSPRGCTKRFFFRYRAFPRTCLVEKPCLLTRIQARALGSTPGLAIPQLPCTQQHGCGGVSGVGVGVLPTSGCCVCVWGVLIQKPTSRFDYRCPRHEFLIKPPRLHETFICFCIVFVLGHGLLKNHVF